MSTKGSETELAQLKAMTQELRVMVKALELKISRLQDKQHGRRHHIVVARVEKEKCIACGICEQVCPAHAVHVKKTANIDPEICRGCGWCVQACPKGAISLSPLKPRESAGRPRYRGARTRINTIRRRGYYGGDFLW